MTVGIVVSVVLSVKVLLSPLAAAAEAGGVTPRIGYLLLAPLVEKPSPERAAFLRGLGELGYVEGKSNPGGSSSRREA